MTGDVAQVAARIALRLPGGVVQDIAAAAGRGEESLRLFAASASSAPVRHACVELLSGSSVDSRNWSVVETALRAAAAAVEAAQQVTVETVWTGPTSVETGHRFTSAVVLDLVDSARECVLLVSYATHDWPPLERALGRARDRGVHVVLVLERPQDNPSFHQWGVPFERLDVTRLAWPSDNRPTGSVSLHAKVLVVDHRAALVGSANLTDSAMDRNLECGVVIRGGPEPRRLWDHVMSLRDREVLVPVGRV